MNVITRKYDIAIIGGGMAGVMAAVAAARGGLSTIILESQGCLGGTRTAGAVDTLYGFFSTDGKLRRIVGGLAYEVVQRLQSEGYCFERENTYGMGRGYTHDIESLKYILDDMSEKAGAETLFYASMFDVCTETVQGKKVVKSVDAAIKNGVIRVEADLFIDSTGDADLIFNAGGSFVPLGEGEHLQSMTTIFFIAGVDMKRMEEVSHPKLVEYMKKAQSEGFQLSRLDGSYHKTPYEGILQANMVRVPGADGADAFSLSKAEKKGRAQARSYVQFLTKYVPGFENAKLLSTAQHIGVRETRQVRGAYVLTESDVVNARKFDDGIVLCAAPVEEHHGGTGTRWAKVGGDGVYQIPYRCLLPDGFKNVAVAGRCLSATHGAQASARNVAQVMAMGHAVGAAAKLAMDNCDFSLVDINSLQEILLGQGALLK